MFEEENFHSLGKINTAYVSEELLFECYYDHTHNHLHNLVAVLLHFTEFCYILYFCMG